jgi:hypothetical protein
MTAFRAQPLRTLATHVVVGVGAASFWRGAWYLLDDHLYPEDPVKSAAASMGLGVIGLTASQGLVERAERLALSKKVVRPSSLAIARFGAIYSVAVSCVLVWRGTWVGWDCLYEYLHPCEKAKSTDPGHATHSGLLSHAAALTLLLTTGLFASVLAPPAAISVIRDHTVRSRAATYSGPAQSMVNQLFRSSPTIPRAAAVRGLTSTTSRTRSPATPKTYSRTFK